MVIMKAIYKSKKEIVYDELRNAILHGNYAPGTRIVIDDAAQKLGVSAIPVREALRQLEADGFVTIAPYIGATVTEIDAESIFEIFTLLEAMETVCAGAAITRITDSELTALEKTVAKMDDCLENCGDDFNKWTKLNRTFHLQICDIAQTRLIAPMLRKVFDHWERLRLHYMEGVLLDRLQKAQQEHHQIVAALRQRDGDETKRLLRLHNQHALAAYDQYLHDTGHLTET